MTDLLHAADVSAYSKPTAYTEDDWNRLSQHGVELAIVGSWHGSQSNTQAEAGLLAAERAGLLTATYVVLNAKSGADTVKVGLSACGTAASELLFCALDVELAGINPKVMQDAVAELKRHNLPACVYTARWFWQGRIGDPSWGKDLNLPLWDARYGDHPDLELPTNYGNWGSIDLVGRQWEGTTNRFGISFDRNVFDRAWIAALVNG